MTRGGRPHCGVRISGLKVVLAALLLVFILGGKAYADSLFELTVTSEGATSSQGFGSVQQLLDNTLQSLRVGGTYVFGRDYKSWEFNAGYTF
jgi:hypothetical protein